MTGELVTIKAISKLEYHRNRPVLGILVEFEDGTEQTVFLHDEMAVAATDDEHFRVGNQIGLDFEGPYDSIEEAQEAARKEWEKDLQ